ncbi:MAG: tetratricopeptide repeat protein [Myxococcales bacterium]|nr:tetratricopeptide repeat protein [Myxococcales bacterium]
MPGTPMACPDENLLGELARGDLTPKERTELEAHLDQCPACAQVVSELTKIFASSFAAEASGLPPLERSADASTTGLESTEAGVGPHRDWPGDLLLPEGARLGRYVVLQAVGAGAMGVVYAAYDPELDRKIALKVLRGASGSSFADSQSDRNKRLLREAQALARLSHPGVITVHDVGTFEGQVFIAMEFVGGGTLTEWLHARPHPWREVLRVFRQAGEGLAAAHEAGLVHRDFKPDNVLIHADGRAVVTDFGLARPLTRGADAEATVESARLSESLGSSASGSALAETLTRTGALVGTPAYMAPEQLEGQRCDALSDQYGFCVALYEGLYGERPFRARDLASLVTKVLEGQLPAPPRGREVPRWLRRAVARGLRVRPEERHPSMRALLGALRSRSLGSWGGVAAIATLGVAAGATTMALSATTPVEPAAYCDDVAAKLDGAWDEARRAALSESFRATGLPFAADAASRASERLDAYAARWVQAQTEACRAEMEGRDPPAVSDARMTCLARRRSTLASMTAVLAEADAETVMQAPEAVEQLPSLAACLDAGTLGHALAPIPEAEREAVAGVREAIDEAVALRILGRVRDDLAKSEEASRRAEGLQYGPVRAEALQALAVARHAAGQVEQAEALVHQALAAGVAYQHDEVIAQAAAELAFLELSRMGRPQVVERWVALGLAALQALGGSQPHLRANLLASRANAERRRGDLDAAIETGREVLALRERYWGPDHYSVAEPLSELGLALARKGDHVGSVAHIDRAREILRRTYGDAHPHYGALLQNLGTTHFVHGHYAEALETYEESRRLLRDGLGEDHPSVAVLGENVGMVLLFLERYDEALLQVERAQAVQQAVHGARSPSAAASWALVGEIHLRAGRLGPAEAALREALEITAEVAPPDESRRANYESQLGLVLLRQGRVEPARALLAQTLRTQQRTEGEPSVSVAETSGRLAMAHLAAGAVPEALLMIDASVEQYESEDPDPHQHAEARFRRARVLAAAGRIDEARADAARARSIYAERGDQPSRLRAVEAWLGELDGAPAQDAQESGPTAG